MPQVPKSMTADNRPPRTSRLPGATSPWNHTGAPLPRRVHRVRPHGPARRGVDLTVQPAQSLLDLAAQHLRVAPAPVRVRSGGGPVPDRGGTERGQETPEVPGQRRPVDVRGALHGVSGQPPPHRPGERVPRPRPAGRDGGRHGQWQVPGQQRQAAVLLADTRRVRAAAGQARGQPVAEPEGPVVPALAGHRRHRQLRPAGELLGDQGPYEISGDVDHDADSVSDLPPAGDGDRTTPQVGCATA
ncbi:hypothetical protein GCM10020220_022730 [Nonomuraea rubra]